MGKLTEAQIGYLRALEDLRIADGKVVGQFEWDGLYADDYIEVRPGNHITDAGRAALAEHEEER